MKKTSTARDWKIDEDAPAIPIPATITPTPATPIPATITPTPATPIPAPVFVLVFSLVIGMFALCSLAGCQSDPASNPSDDPAGAPAQSTANSAAQPAQAYSDDEIRQTLEDALAHDFSTVSFKLETSTKTDASAQTGAQQSSMRTTMEGELDKSSDDQRFHVNMNVTATTSASEETAFEIFMQGDEVVIVQDGQTFAGTQQDLGLGNYTASITAIISPEGGAQMLDTASELKMEKRENDTAVTIISDARKLSGDEVADGKDDNVSASSTLSSLVTVYVIDADNRISTVMMTGGTAGSPSYHVRQTYTFQDYDATEVPPAPDLPASAAPGVQTDENGRQYMEQDGVRYYLADDGMFYAEASSGYIGGGDDGTQYYYAPSSSGKRKSSGSSPAKAANSAATGSSSSSSAGSSSSSSGSGSSGSGDADGSSSSTGGSSSSSSSSSSQGRAYITAYDGTIHYLDEPGSEIRDFGGTRVFIDADGEWYFLSE